MKIRDQDGLLRQISRLSDYSEVRDVTVVRVQETWNMFERVAVKVKIKGLHLDSVV